jgi:hypothetical protein
LLRQLARTRTQRALGSGPAVQPAGRPRHLRRRRFGCRTSSEAPDRGPRASAAKAESPCKAAVTEFTHPTDRRRPTRGRDSVAAELPLGALWAVEDELRRLVVGEVRRPARLVGWQPPRVALGATRDQRNALSTHEPSLGSGGSRRRRADCPLGYGRLAGGLRSPNVRETRLKGRAASRTRGMRRSSMIGHFSSSW